MTIRILHWNNGFRRRKARSISRDNESPFACWIAKQCRSKRTARSFRMAMPILESNNTLVENRTAPKKVGMISLGCAKNLVDAEIMLGSVRQHGMEITAQADEADVLIVN